MPTKAARGSAGLPYRSGSDLTVLARVLTRAHDDFVTSGTSTPDVRPLVLDSWRRCLRDGLDPERGTARFELDDDALAAARTEHPLFAVMPTIRRLLVDVAVEAGMLVAVSDAAGRLLWVEGASSMRSRAERIAFLPGANWSEASAGTNAPGTALALGTPVQIFGAEHLSRPVTPWSCAAVPVRDPDTRGVVGVLDLTGGPEVAGPQGLALVRATVAAVEAELRLARLTRSGRPSPRAGRRAGRRAAGSVASLQVLGRRRARLSEHTDTDVATELSLRHSEILLLLSEARDGLGAEELAVALSEQELSTVTIRAEMSRLRVVLDALGSHSSSASSSSPSSLCLDSRPYRLIGGIDTDVVELRTAIRSGRLRQAVAHYPGPVLPRSEAPAVVELRTALHHELRRALLDQGDPDALLGFADTDHGRDDLVVWSAASAALPPSSSRHPQVLSHCQDLSRELR